MPETVAHIGMNAMPHLPAFMAQPIREASTALALPADQFRLVLCLLLAIPLGFLHQIVPGVRAKHIYSTLIGIWYGYFVVGYGLFYVWLHALVVYFICMTFPRQRAPMVVFILSMALLSASHIYRMVTDYLGWSLDVTLIQMVYAVKSVTFAYNWADGQALNEEERLHTNDKVHAFREARALRTFPSLLEYHSYTFFFGGLLVGPCFEMREYLEFTNRTVFKQAELKSIPSTVIPTLKVMLNAFFCYIGVVISGMYPVNGLLDSTAFCELPIVPKFIYFWIAITSSRYKYYFAWYLGEAACVASGFGFSGVSRTSAGDLVYHWDRCCNCHALTVETSSSMPLITNHWNMGVNNWLKNYVYFRVEAPRFITRYIPAKSFQNIVTKLTSAAWHGFYSAYYFFFLGAWLINELDDAYRAAFEWRVTKYDADGQAKGYKYPAKYIYHFLGWFLIFSGMNYLGVAFMLLEATASISFWKCMYGFGTIGPIILILLFKPLRKRHPHHKKHDKTATGEKAAVTAGDKTAPTETIKHEHKTSSQPEKVEAPAAANGNKASSTKKKSKKAE